MRPGSAGGSASARVGRTAKVSPLPVRSQLAEGGHHVVAVAALARQYCRYAVQQLCGFVDDIAEAFASLDQGK
ncbi:hypothetical protein PV379_20790 [Streptomyces caniscabiei]|uniref:hypothetical protein n=1 Tax=Streptomyces caniscabiei TaxID=2746961 RepID=UPI0029AA3329|nr:hypothetical protein [Streptomyces caniscabiei]MDX2602368.1 hypothetical protein [Streptomyces caniscabiei]MDX2734224.1 hypothetical protein [Streptomyces caniscabiei]MDX2779736.1 hypothetical protein [Streptomyces caniscabiei]